MRGNKLAGLFALGAFAMVGGLVATDPAFAKVDVDKLTIGGEARIRYEIREGANFISGPNAKSNESAASSRVRVNVGYDLSPDVSFFAQLQDARVWGGEACPTATCSSSGIGAVSSANNGGTGVDLHQGYILVKNVLTPGLSLKTGRQEIIFGDHRLFGNFNWSQIGNSFDAARLTYSLPVVDVDLFWARIADSENGAAGSTSGVIFPGNGSGNIATQDQDIYGLYVTLKPVPTWTFEPYYFLLADHRLAAARAAVAGSVAGTATAAGLISPQTPDQSRNVLGGRINGKAGGLDLTAEAVWQFGAIASGSAATGNDENMHINAHAEAFKIGYTFEPVPMKPRIGFEFDYASGDDCVNKTGASSCASRGRLNTFDNLYPTNHFHYGYMDLMAWRNMVNYQVNFDIKPDPVSKIQVNFILHRLARKTDNWYRAGQVPYVITDSSNQAASLGKELDVHYFRTFKEKFKFEIGYGHFFTGELLDPDKNGSGPSINGCVIGSACTSGASDKPRDQDWAYMMVSVLF